jgi:hypothetical protein
MKNKEFLTEAKRKAIVADKEKAIIESFAKTFNKIKRVDENTINEFEEENQTYSDREKYGINPEIEPDEYGDLEHDELSEENGNEGLVDTRTTLAYRLVKQISGILKDEMYTEPDEYGMTTPELLKTFLYNFDAVDNGEGKIIGFRKGDLTSFTKRAKNYLANNDLVYVDDNGMVNVNNSNSPEIANLLMKLENL